MEDQHIEEDGTRMDPGVVARLEELLQALPEPMRVAVVLRYQEEMLPDICTRSGDHGDSNEMVIMTAEPLELTFVHLRGRVSMSDLGKMSSSMSMSSDTSKSKDKDM